MPPKKKASRAAQLAPQPTPESDTENYTDIGVAMAAVPPPPNRTNEELNMLVLRRWYPSLQEIIAIAPFSNIYIFNAEQQWDKTEIQGTLFVCQLQGDESPHPSYKIILLNRKSIENWTYDIRSQEDIELSEEYVMVQKLDEEEGEMQIYGIWIFHDGEPQPNPREVIAQAVMECGRLAEEFTGGSGNGYAENGHEEYDEDQQQKYYGQQAYSEPQVEQRSHSYGAPVQQPQLPPQQVPLQTEGQRIDMATLFGKSQQPQAPPEETYNARQASQPQLYSENRPGIPNHQQQQRFPSTADTDFFRSSNSPAAVPQQQAAPPPTQQNALLDLFKNAKRA